ncbi:MAG: SUMF1/EgtB/PvdO family nonheme iron enzyme [Saprospiraceae bacterium]
MSKNFFFLIFYLRNLSYNVGWGCWHYKDDTEKYGKYGRLYTWEGANKACPPGWRLPTQKEWLESIKLFGGYFDDLTNINYGNTESAYLSLTQKLKIDYLAGYYEQNQYHYGNIDSVGSYWSSTKIESNNYLYYDFAEGKKIIFQKKDTGFLGLSVRCVRDTKLDTNAKLILPKEELITDPPRLTFEPEMVFVQGGKLKRENGPEVTLKDFYIGKYQVTVKEYLEFANATKSHFPEWMEEGSKYNFKTGSDDHYKKLGEALTNDSHPIVGISWNDAKAYCQWLSKETGKKYRLPTESEWEYAARGGNQSKNFEYAGSNHIDEVAWYNGNSGGKTHPVGTAPKSNELGIYDMSGNVWEWCEDVWHDDYKGAPADGSAWISGGDQNSHSRVVRGGSWFNLPNVCRAAYRGGSGPNDRADRFGFRLVRH